MALVVCEEHQGKPGPTRDAPFVADDDTEYVVAVDPLGYPDTAVICSVEGCENPGQLLLEQSELDALEHPPHRQIFTGAAAFTKVKIA